MTQPLDLDQIDTLTAAATPGPWKVELEQCDCSDGLCSHGTYVSAVYANGERRTEFVDFPDADWQFAIRARTDVPAMAAEIRRLRARTLTPSEYSAAWHAVEGAAGEEGADPGTVLHAVLDRLGIDWHDAALPAAEETHVVADDSDDPEHIDDCPGCEDTLPAWLHQRFDPHGPDWNALSDDDRAYWQHQARAVRRAVTRGGFKTDPAAVSAAARP